MADKQNQTRSNPIANYKGNPKKEFNHLRQRQNRKKDNSGKA
jgi:hypothetical protein